MHCYVMNRFFIVIDDIWDAESWKNILYSLKDSNCGSRIIMTTRNADLVPKGQDVYKLKPLSHDNSKILFKKRILSGEEECLINQLDELSDKILRKCDGVPLAIIAISSMLADKPGQKWSEVYDYMVSGHGDSTMEIISYSYNDLPSHLKPCLLYMSTFPEEYWIKKYSLIWMWIGEGLVQIEKEGDNIFEQGERYFNELINRSMLQPIEDRNDRSISGCSVHDILYELICKLSKEENFTSVSVGEQHISFNSERRRKGCLETKARRLSLRECHFESIPQDTWQRPDVVRSLYLSNSTINSMFKVHCFHDINQHWAT